MRKLCTAGLVSLILCAAIAAAQKPRQETAESRGFRCHTGQRLSDRPDSALIYIALSVPYDNLTFVRSDESGFVSRFEATFLIFDKDDNLAAERSIDMDLHTESFKETNSRTLNAVRTEEFYVIPGDYDLAVVITDRETKRKRRWEGDVTAAFMDSLLAVSDLYWQSDDSSQSALGMPRVIESFSNRDDSARAGIDLVSLSTTPLDISWSVVGEDDQPVLSFTEQVSPTGSIQHIEYLVAIRDLPVQKYKLTFEALGSGRREARSLSFSVSIPGVPASVTDISLAIRQVKYIATAEENRRLRGAGVLDREQLFREFWKRRDPTPNTPQNELMDEYYFRVQYADDRYSTHRPGWETDRGRIYIMYGEPTDIERHPFEAGSRPYEIWYYHNLNRRFVFVDHTGFGDYNLAGPEWGY